MTENPNQPRPDDGHDPDQPITDSSWSPYDDIPDHGAPGASSSAAPGSTPSSSEPGPAGPAGAGDTGRVDPKAAWSDAGERLGGLGSKLRRHYEERAGAGGPEAGAEVKDAAKKLGEAVQNAFEAFGSAAKDPQVKDDVRQVGRSVSDALSGTLAGLSGELRKTFGRDEDPQKPKHPDAPA